MNLDDIGERLVADMPDALVVADAGGIIRVWNSSAERIFGFARGEALGQSLDIITPAKLRPRHWAGYRRTMRAGQTRYGAGDLLSVPAIRKDGQRVSIQFSILPLAGPDGALEGIVAIIRDVSAEFETRNVLQRDLEECRRQLLEN